MTAAIAPDAAEDRVGDIERAIIEAAALPLERSVTLPREAYVDEAFFRNDVKKVLETDWLCLAHVSQLKGPGSYLTLDLFDEPLMVMRDRDGTVRVLSRVCPHRAMDVMPPELDFGGSGQVKSIVCPYHRWAFDFDGTLKGCPEMHLAEGFRTEDWRLAEFRAEVWNGFVFVNFSGRAAPVAQQYEGLARVFAPWKIAEMEQVIGLDWDCNFNWKVMVENWNESYHHLGIHHQTLHVMTPAQMTWSEETNPHYTRSHLPYEENTVAAVKASLAGGPPLPGFNPIAGLTFAQQTEWGLFVGFPCFMLLTFPDRVVWYRLIPVAANRCRLFTTTLVPRDNLTRPDFAALVAAETEMLKAFHMEDMRVCAGVQRGLYSRTVAQGRLSHLEEPIWQLFRYYAARYQRRYPEPGAGGRSRPSVAAVA